MDVPTYWDGGSQESVCDPSRPAWASYYSLGTTGHDFTFDFMASGTYRIYFYFMDNDRNDPQNDKGVYYLRTTAEVTVNDAARPSVTQIVNNAVAQCRQETNGSEWLGIRHSAVAPRLDDRPAGVRPQPQLVLGRKRPHAPPGHPRELPADLLQAP